MELETCRCLGEAGALVLHEDVGGGTARSIGEEVDEHGDVIKSRDVGERQSENGRGDGQSSLT